MAAKACFSFRKRNPIHHEIQENIEARTDVNTTVSCFGRGKTTVQVLRSSLVAVPGVAKGRETSKIQVQHMLHLTPILANLGQSPADCHNKELLS